MHNRLVAGSACALAILAVAGLMLLPAFDVNAATASGSRPASGLSAVSSSRVGALEPDTLEPIALYPRANYTWPYATGPFYGEVEAAREFDPGVVRLEVGSFDLSQGTPVIPTELQTTAKLERPEGQYFILAYRKDIAERGGIGSIREAVVSGGGAIVQELGTSAYIVRLNAASFAATESAPGVAALEPYHPAFKISRMLGTAPLPDPVQALSDVYDLDVTVFAGESSVAIAQAIRSLGGNVVSTSADVVRAEVHRDRIASVAGIEGVNRIFEHLPVFLHGAETTAVMQTGRWNGGATPYHDVFVNGGGARGTCSTTTTVRCQGAFDCPGVETCTGAGSPQTLMIIDSGIQIDAGDLSDTRTSPGTVGAAHRKVRKNAVAIGGTGDALGCDDPAQGGFTHGHVVASTALGNATRVPTRYGAGWAKFDANGNSWPIDGVAPRAVLVSYDANVTPLQGSCADPLNAGLVVGTIWDGAGTGSLEVGYTTDGARTFNFSWGTTNNPSYSTNATRVDSFLFNTATYPDAMVFISAGNDGRDTDSNGVPDPGSVSDPATAKNAIVVGGSGNTSEPFNGANEQDRFFNSSVGPATPGSNRVAPILMAPGTDFGAVGGNMGFDSEFACRSNDNNQTTPVECDVSQGSSGTSFASPAAAGAAMLVRDYFAQGFYPDGTSSNPANAGDVVTALSGQIVKAILIASADWMDNSSPAVPTNAPGDNLFARYRFNNEQGYGRIQLNNALPLQNYNPTPVGLIITDGVNPAGRKDISGLTGDINTGTSETDTGTFTVCDDTKELRVALSWPDAVQELLGRNLDLELQAPSGKIYYGNYFTDDNNRDATTTAGEDCPNSAITGSISLLDESPWSLVTCANAVRDNANPTEAIFLSPDARADGSGVGFTADKQTEVGTWTIRVRTGAASQAVPAALYAVAVAGGVCSGSSVQLNLGSYVCNQSVTVTVNERAETPDTVDPVAGLTVAEVALRSSIEVVSLGADGQLGTTDDVVTDIEDSTSGLSFTAVGLRFTSNAFPLTDGTVAVPHNGSLDVRNGQVLRAIYRDKSTGAFDANKRRTSTATMACAANVTSGGVTFGQFGLDTSQLVNGGCERDARNLFTFGFPDKYMDSGERVAFRIAFQSSETVRLTDVQASLRCVLVDADSPADCLPGTTQCADPNRANNTSCGSLMTILDSPKNLGDLPAGSIATPSFSIQMGTISGTPKVEMLLGVSAKKSGRTVETLIVSRNTLNADEQSLFYSTDFPTGGTEFRDYPLGDVGTQPSNEVLDNPTTNAGEFNADYRFDTIQWSSLQATGRNSTISPWNFDSSRNGFTVGLNNTSTTGIPETIANWGEDKNFNGVLDWFCANSPTTVCPGFFPVAACGTCSNNPAVICAGNNVACGGGGTTCNVVPALGDCVSSEDRDSANGSLDDNWGTLGGCGWQTNGTTNDPITAGGVWHTGRIGVAGANPCLYSGNGSGACQNYETLTGTTNVKRQWELLLSPTVQKVNQCNTDAGPLPAGCDGVFDTATEKVFQVQFLDWAWNMALDLRDRFATVRWEFDTDTTKIAPVDLFNDAVTLNAFGGNMGPVSGGNSPLLDGYPVFAPFLGTTSQNGTVGSNRVGRNPCYFETSPRTNPVFHFADPTDDDLDNDGDTQVDEFVYPNGPLRNFTMQQVNGPDMRFSTFEDIYGASGENFQAAIGFRVFEGTAAAGAAQTSFGAAVDDMVFQWREFKLAEDATNCSTTGACAVVEIDSGNVFEGNGNLTISVTDSSPYDRTNAVNDCNFDGDFVDAGVDDTDCNNNGTTDVTVLVLATGGPDASPGERLVLDRVGASDTYRGTIPISTTTNTVGLLFVQDGGPNNPEARVRYNDRWDGVVTGSPATDVACQNDPDPNNWGTVTANVNVGSITGAVTVKSFTISDASGTGTPPLPAGQDGDGYPDTNETIDMFITVSNKTGQALTNVVAQLATSDPKIDCVLKSSIVIGSIPAASSVASTDAFRFKISAVADRSGAIPPVSCTLGQCSNLAGACASAANCQKSEFDDYSAAFTITIASDQFDINTIPQGIVADLDLNSRNPVVQTSVFADGFESGLLNFVNQNLDEGFASNTLSNGKRCQYNDPDFVNSNSFGDTECYLGFILGQTNVNDWHIHDTTTPDGGRAYLGVRSLHYGIHTAGSPGLDTYGLSQMDAIQMNKNVNLAARVCANDTNVNKRSCNLTSECVGPAPCPGCTGTPLCVSANPELSFKHQISTTDSRSTNTPAGQAADRAVVQARLYRGGTPGGAFQKLTPYENVYDVQGTDNFSNCLFDPDDDGNNEDSYFDPTDPDRRLGPSSTCFPEFAFSFLGDTDAAFGIANIGRASDGPGLVGSLGTGTWVESKFDLSRYRGRQIRIRYLITTIKVSDTASLEALFMWNPNPGDDGWYVDDFRVTGATGTLSPTVSLDTIDNSALPGCGVACNTLTTSLVASPSTTTAPGNVVSLTAQPAADRCVSGTLLYQFWIDGNLNGTLGEPADTLLQDFTPNPLFQDAPLLNTRYGVLVKCSSATSAPCNGAAGTTQVTVGCPGTPAVYNAEAWWTGIRFTNKTTITAPTANQTSDLARGLLSTLRVAPGNYGSTTCLADNSSSVSFTDATNPNVGDGFYYLLRGQGSLCNENTKYTTFSPKETPTAVGRRDDVVNGVTSCGP